MAFPARRECRLLVYMESEMFDAGRNIISGVLGPKGDPACRFALFNRHGGLSQAPFASLNCSHCVGDDPMMVVANRSRIKSALNLDCLVSAGQVHGNQVLVLEESPGADQEFDGYDAIVTPLPGVGIMVQHADCQAVLLCDPVRMVVAAVHSGWRGSVANIVGATIRLMHDRYTSKPTDILAVISPSLGPCCSEFINYRLEFPEEFLDFRASDTHFDFWRITRQQLVKAGLHPSSVNCAEICTSCNSAYFSYRRSRREGHEATGRNCSVVVLADKAA